jgi:hypothetical protein
MNEELKNKNQNRYKILIERIFVDNYQANKTEIAELLRYST